MVEYRKISDVLVLSFPEHVILSNIEEIRNNVKEIINKEDFYLLVIDLSITDFIDSSGIGFLFALGKENKKNNKEVFILNQNPKIASLLKLVCLDRMYPTTNDLEKIIIKKANFL